MTQVDAELRRADGAPVRVLVVEDEVSLAELLTMALRYEGWDVRSAGDGFSAVRTAREFGPDLVVLDIMLPDIDGLEVLRRLRAGAPTLPVLFLTAKDAVEDRIAGLTVGGDDYVTKPFSLEEVMARLRALLRRSGMTVGRTPAVVVGDLVLERTAVRSAATATSWSSLRRSSSCCVTSCATLAGCCPRLRSSTRCGITISAAIPTSSSSTFPTCVRRLMPAGHR
jgi:CheY-like chemotaxis protein